MRDILVAQRTEDNQPKISCKISNMYFNITISKHVIKKEI